MKIGFTGTQEGMTQEQLNVLEFVLKRSQEEYDELHHGDCIGADGQAHEMAQLVGIKVIIHPPIEKAKRAWKPGAYQVLRPKPYLQRNHDIVDACDMLIATPRTKEEVLRSGTWATIRYAHKQHKDIAIILPDGTIQIGYYKEGA